MKYRKFGSFEWQSSILGFGATALPMCENAAEPLDTAAFVKTIRCAIDFGINYLDLGYPYDLGLQQRIAEGVGEALRDGYCEKVKIAVTLPSHLLRAKSDLDRYLNLQLKLLGIERADFCLFGRLDRDSWPILQRLEAPDWAAATISDRRIGAIGFSFHDHFQVLRRILGAYDRWSLCQFQFSYMDIDHDPGIAGIKYAASKGIAIVVTEPLRSGRLAKEPPCEVRKIWGDDRSRSRLVKWGLHFVWSYPEVAVAVCDFLDFPDFRSMRDLIESADISDSWGSDGLSVQEELLIHSVRDEYRRLKRIPCSSCSACMPCPEEINVPRIFELYNDAFIYEDLQTARRIHRSELHHAELCNACGECEKRCARRLKIVDWLRQANLLLG